MSKYSKLYAFGCSFTKEVDTTTQVPLKKLFWPEYLGKKLNVEVENNGKSGYSNHSIFLKATKIILADEDKIDNALVIIGLTDMTRQLLFQADIFGRHPNPIEHMNRYFSDILMMQSFLEKHNVDYRMFSALAPTPGEDEYFYQNYFLKTIQSNIDYEKIIGWPFFKRLGGYSFWHYIQEDKSRMTDDFHPTETAHKEWAEYLYNEI